VYSMPALVSASNPVANFVAHPWERPASCSTTTQTWSSAMHAVAESSATAGENGTVRARAAAATATRPARTGRRLKDWDMMGTLSRRAVASRAVSADATELLSLAEPRSDFPGMGHGCATAP